MKRNSTLFFLVNQFKPEAFSSQMQIGKADVEKCKKQESHEYAPSEQSVRAILDFARSLQVEDTQTVGKVEYIIN